jgi:hypothetical protein
MVLQSQSDQRAGPDMRVSDAEREEVAQTLVHHHGEGRLDAAELDQRLNLTYRARTQGELAEVVNDLPPRPLPATPVPPPRPRPRTPILTLFAVGAFALLIATSVLTDRHLVWGIWWIFWLGLWIVRPWHHRYSMFRHGTSGGEVVSQWRGQRLN